MILPLVACAASVYTPPGHSTELHELHILQVYHIVPPIDAHEIFSQYHMYFLTGSHFAQNLKIASPVSIVKLKRINIALGHGPNLGLPIAKESLIWFT